MLILGIHGSKSLEQDYDPGGWDLHDSAAVLLRDGEVVAGIEEERLSRIKHTNCFPVRAIQYCLQEAGCTLGQVDLIATNNSELQANMSARIEMLNDSSKMIVKSGRERLGALLEQTFGVDVRSKLFFCHHHLAHAWSTFAASGFNRSLIVSVDGAGDGCAGMVLVGNGHKLTKLRELTMPQSLGHLYQQLIKVIGYDRFDEYKVMGLAPYGDARKYSKVIDKCYSLLPNGDYKIEPLITWMESLDSVGLITGARRKEEPFSQAHKDFAATLQEALENIVLHMLRYYRDETGEENLCLAGGVAHNCTMNGRVLSSGYFENVFVQPAAHDAGGALGAALSAFYERSGTAEAKRIEHVYWGTSVEDEPDIERKLSNWAGFVEYRKEEQIAKKAAGLLADGAVLGWVQGRSEFGPRALGNRCILADPRPADNKSRINQMIKKREAYRPFAPSVLVERVGEYFIVPTGQAEFPFMIFVLPVREDKRALLGAVTHVDGTARVQTVSREMNARYWELISEFEKLTGVPMVLNTSFNNNAEPIVNDIDQAITCFLTTGINYLVIGDYLVEKKSAEKVAISLKSLAPELPIHRQLVKRWKKAASESDMQQVFEIASRKSKYFGAVVTDISAVMHKVLQGANSHKTIEVLMKDAGVTEDEQGRLLNEFMSLWTSRTLNLRPGTK